MSMSPVSQMVVVQQLHEALPVSEEATTSRTLVSNEAARVVAFAMDEGQELTDHATPRPAVVVVTAGTLEFTVAGSTHELTVGDAVYLAPGERHALVARTPSRFELVLVTAADG
jgi:quercetin dioxygenase-like cupin family protein